MVVAVRERPLVCGVAVSRFTNVMHAELTAPVPRVAYENLLGALMYERDAINAAYDSLLALVHRGLRGEGAMLCATSVLHGLTGMLRFIFERVYHHTGETSVTFLKESGTADNALCAEAVAALHDAIMVKVLSPSLQKSGAGPHAAAPEEGGDKLRGVRPRRCLFAVSSHYELEAQGDILNALTRRLSHTAVVLPRCEAAKEMGLALQLGCSVLVSPSPPAAPCAIAYATKERLLQYAHSALGEEDDDELNALLHELDSSARSSSLLTEAALTTEQKSPTAVVSRRDLRGALGDVSHATTHDGGDRGVVAWESPTGTCVQPPTGPIKRPRIDSFHAFSVVSDPADASPLLSQVIQYQPERPLGREFSRDEEDAKRPVLDTSRWRFQLSNSLKESKNELVKAIRQLGGHVENSSTYNPQTTHLVVAEGLAERTEKYLSCCAALKFIVSPCYVLDSLKRGKWLVDRLHEYDRNPLRRLVGSPMTLPFTGWHVVLFTSTSSVSNGVVTVLKAGGCADITSYVFDGTETPNIDFELIEQSSHILVESQKLSETGCFLLPPWFPQELKRQDRRFFSLELLFHLLCFCTVSLFDENGQVLDTRQLPPSCRLEFD